MKRARSVRVGSVAAAALLAGAIVVGGSGAAFAFGGNGGRGNNSGYGNSNNGNNNNGNSNNGYGNNGNGNDNGSGHNRDNNDNDNRHDDGHHHHRQGALFVAPTGQMSNSGQSCYSAQYSTIQSALNDASSGATVIVCAGTYNENPIVSMPVSLQGENAIIDATSTANGMCDQLGEMGPGSAPCLAGLTIKSSDVSVSGFTVENAFGEGILATGSLAGGSISDITISNNTVTGNDTGANPPIADSVYPQCSGVPTEPGDCGEGIHLMGAYNSQVSNNFVSGNSGGVLLTDEFGPTHDNVVESNVITGNQFDCGITVPGHNPMALDMSGNPQPAVAGVYNNVIRFNAVTDNGRLGEGAGILFATPAPGTASYNNVAEYNFLSGNALSGVTMHQHTLPPGGFSDLSGNQVIGNVIGQNNLGGPVAPADPLDGPTGAQDAVTTGILVFSASAPLQVTIAFNHVFGNTDGVWLGEGGHVNATLIHNSLHNNTTPVFTAP